MKASWGVYSIITVVLGALGVGAPIGWDWYKSRKALEVQLLNLTKIIDPAEKLEKLEIRYAGELIPSLSRVTFSIVNTGRTPIEGSHFVSPVTITFSDKARLLEVKTERREPENLDVQQTVDRQRNLQMTRSVECQPGSQQSDSSRQHACLGRSRERTL